MKWATIILFIIGCLFFNAGYGANEKRQKVWYYSIAGAVWLALFLMWNHPFFFD
jgi:asparagine N-glycosylation enzyme membrane subunit Stt3